MPQAKPEDIAVRLAKALTRKAQWQSLYDNAARLAMPNRNMFRTNTQGTRKDEGVYDSTLSLSQTRLANRLQSELFPIFQKWGDLVPGQFIDVKEEQLEELKQILRRVRDIFFAAISVSNFDSVINEFLLDLGLGTGALLVLEGDDHIPIRFVSVPLAELAFEDGPWGTVGAVFHITKVAQGLLESMYPDSIFVNDAKPEDWDTRIADDPQKLVKVFSITYSDFKRTAGGEFLWYYDVFAAVDVSTSMHKELGIRIVSATYPDNPWIVGRWSKLPGEDFGRGPAIFALPDALTLNKIVELILRNAGLAIAPPLLAVDDGSWNLNIAVVRPNVVIPVASNTTGGRGPSLQALDLPQDFTVADLLIDNLVEKIKKAMLDDQLPAETGAIRSPTEIIERVKQLQQDVGSPFGRLHSEVLRPLFQRGINILIKKGIIKIPGVNRINVDGTGIDVRAVSRLARVQSLSELEAAVQWIELQGVLGERAKLLNVQAENWGRWSADKLSIDSQIVRQPNEQKQLMESMQRAEAQATAAQQRQSIGVQRPQEPLPIAA